MEPSRHQPLDFVDDLLCPASLAQWKSAKLELDGEVLSSPYERFPIISGIPDLRLGNDREGTSYDNILPESEPAKLDAEAVKLLGPAFGVNREYIEGKKVPCLSG